MIRFLKRVKLKNIDVKLNVLDKTALNLIDSLNITENDLKYVKNLQPHVNKHLDKIVDEFYKAIHGQQELVNIISSNSTVDRLKRTLTSHLDELFKGNIDDSYIERRYIVGKVHLRIGLGSTWYVASFEPVQNELSKLMVRVIKNHKDRVATLEAINKLIKLEQCLVLASFDAERDKQEREIKDTKSKVSAVVVENSNSLAAISEEALASYEEMLAQVTNVMDILKKAEGISKEMLSSSHRGRDIAKNQSESMNGIVASTRKMQEDIEVTAKVAIQIEELMTEINDIASQTNLLSLNAQIEAAKSGEAGKGFAVIAQEIKSLSLKTTNAIKDVGALLNSITEGSQILNSAVHGISENVEQGEESMRETVDGLMRIISKIEDNEEQNQIIVSDMRELEIVINELSKAFSDVADLATELNGISSELLK